MTISLKHTYTSPIDAGSSSWTGNITSGSNQITSVSPAPTNAIVGYRLYNANIPAGTTVSSVSGTTITMSANATGSGTSAVFYTDDNLVQSTDWNAEHALTMGTGKLLGRTSASTGAAEEISIGTGLSLSSGTLTNTAVTPPGGSDTQVQYNSSGAFGGSAALTFGSNTLQIGKESTTTGLLALGNASSANLTKIQAGNATSAVTYTLPTADGTNGQALVTNGSGTLAWNTVTTAAAGSNTQLQFNNSGAFGGDSTLTFNSTSKLLTANRFSLSGNISSAAWTTSGIRYANVAGTLTDTSSSGTVATAYTNVYGGNTIAASNSTTFTNYYNTFIAAPVSGTNVTFTNAWALGLDGAAQIAAGTLNGTVLDISQAWSGTGTYTGIKYNVSSDSGPANAASLLLDLQVGGTSRFKVEKSGAITANSNISTASGSNFLTSNNFWVVSDSASASGIAFGTAADARITRKSAANIRLGLADTAASSQTYTADSTTDILTSGAAHGLMTGAAITFTNSGGALPTGITAGTVYYAVVQSSTTIKIATSYANATASSPTVVDITANGSGTTTGLASSTQQSLSVQSFTGTNVSGSPLVINGSQGTGTGAGGSIIFQTAAAGSSGSSQNALTTALTIGSNTAVTISNLQNTSTSSDNATLNINSQNRNGGINLQAGSATSVWSSSVVFQTVAGSERGRITYVPQTDYMAFQTNGTTERLRIDSSGNIFSAAAGSFGFNSTTLGSGSQDLFLTRRGAANLRLGAADAAAPVAQILSVQSVVATTTDTNGANFTITGSQSTGTGTAGTIIFQTSSRAASTGSAQNALASVMTIGPNTLTGTQAISLLNLTQTWDTTGAPTALLLNVTNTASDAASLLFDLQVGGTSQFKVSRGGNVTLLGLLQLAGTTSSFPALKRSSTTLQVRLADDSADAPINALSGTFTDNTANTSAISSTGYSLTGSSSVSLVDLAGTWNTTGTPSAIKLNITDTASNAASLLFDIGTGGGSYASVFSVGKTGNIKLGPNATGTDQNGTSVTISGSLGTGTGASGNLVRQTGFSAKSTGSGANTLVARDVIVAKGKVLTDATATSLFEVALPTLTMCGGTITATTVCTDGTDMQSITEVVTFSAVNKGGVYTTDIDVGTTSSAISGGTLANTWTVLTGTNKITIQLSSDTSLTPSSNSFLVYYQIKNNSEQAITVV